MCVTELGTTCFDEWGDDAVMTVWEAVYLLQPLTTLTLTYCSLQQCSVFNYCTFVHHTHMSVVFEHGVTAYVCTVPDVGS